jgi:conjugative relaxase-like TrwC/TraI family protein
MGLAYVTQIGFDRAQVEYRLTGCGCSGPDGAAERRFSHRADRRERSLRWIGRGLAEVGIIAGSELTPTQFDWARALLAGRHPHSHEQLVTPKLAVPEDAKVALSPLIRAIRGAGAEAAVTVEEVLGHRATMVTLFRAAERAWSSRGEMARLRADEAGRLADAAGLSVDEVWGEQVYEQAVRNLVEVVTDTDPDGTVTETQVPRRVVVGNAGYDVTVTLPKSFSLLLAFADEDTAHAVEETYTAKVETTFAWLEDQTAYGMRGKHGGGRRARTVPGSGFLGWTTTHRAARPVPGGEVGDPHWHMHITIANLARGVDGQWSTVAAGGRDLMRHAAAMDHVLKALVRHDLAARFGASFVRSPRTGAWEVAGVPEETVRRFSKRHRDIEKVLGQFGVDVRSASRAQHRIAEQRTRGAKGEGSVAPDTTLRELWQQEERAAGRDPGEHARRALPGADNAPPPPEAVTAAEIAAQLLDPETGLTAHGRRFSRLDVIARVADAMPGGFAETAELETMTDAVLAQPGFVALSRPDHRVTAGGRSQLGASHMRNAQTYTTRDVVDVETTILRAARASHPDQSPTRVSDPDRIDLAVAVVEAQQGYELSLEQRYAVHRLVGQGRLIDTVNGAPGTGKTTLMRAVRAVFEAAGFTVAGAATAAVAAHHLGAESGIHTRTVASWLARLDAGDRSVLRGVDVLVIDEANLAEDRSRARLYEQAGRTGTRIIEIGDHRQLRGVGVGSLFALVHEIVDGAVLEDNRRQADEDERAAIGLWRDSRYAEALAVWADKGRLTVTETAVDAAAAMLRRWWDHRQGVPSAHDELRGLVMLAGTNEQVRRLNQAAQALRRTHDQLGAAHTYRLPRGEDLTLHVGDHVLLRLNDRRLRHGATAPVLNGYRGVVTHIVAPGDGEREPGTVTVEWRDHGPDGLRTRRADLAPRYVALGGVELGYAMTVHKSEGLTIGAAWTRSDGVRAGGTVLVDAAGMDSPQLHVATSRHTQAVHLHVARADLATPTDGSNPGGAHRLDWVIDRLAAHARATETHRDDEPVVAELGLPEFAAYVRRSADSAGGDGVNRADGARRSWRDRAQARADAERHRARQVAARRARADSAVALIRAVWADHTDLVERVVTDSAFSVLARNLHDADQAGYDTAAILGTVLALAPAGRLAAAEVRHPAAYVATLVDHITVSWRDGSDAGVPPSARDGHAGDQVADLLRDAWSGRPDLAETVVGAAAFPALVAVLDRYHRLGLDARDLLAAVPVSTLADTRTRVVRDAAAYTSYLVHTIADARLGAATAELPLSPDELHDAAQLVHDTWHAHPDAARTVVGASGFPLLAQRLYAAHADGHDVAAILAGLDARALTAGRMPNAAGPTTHAVSHALRTAASHPAPESRPIQEPEPGSGAPGDRPAASAAASAGQRHDRLAVQYAEAVRRAAELHECVVAGSGPHVTRLRDDLTRLRERAEAVRRLQHLQDRWQAAVAQAAAAAEQRTVTEQELAAGGRQHAGRRAQAEPRIQELTRRHEHAQEAAVAIAAELAPLRHQAGDLDRQRHTLTLAAAAEADYPHAMDVAQRRDHQLVLTAQRRVEHLAGLLDQGDRQQHDPPVPSLRHVMNSEPSTGAWVLAAGPGAPEPRSARDPGTEMTADDRTLAPGDGELER